MRWAAWSSVTHGSSRQSSTNTRCAPPTVAPLTCRRCLAADRLISPEPYTIFNRRDSSFALLKGWQIFVDLPAPKKAQVLLHSDCALQAHSPPSLQVEATCKLAGATVLRRMPTYVETVVPLKAKLRGLEIDMHGCAACSRQISRCRRCSGSLTLFAVRSLAAAQRASSRASHKSSQGSRVRTARS